MFDCVIINPPYNNSTHMRFLQNALEHSARFVVSIQPCAWLFSKNNKVIGGSATRDVIKAVEDHGADIELVRGISIFDAALTQDISINTIDKTKHSSIDVDFGDFRGKHSFKRVSEITKFMMLPEAKSLIDKIKKLSEDREYDLSLWDMMKGEFHASLGTQCHKREDRYVPNDREWIVSIAGVRGHRDVKTGGLSDDFYTIVPRDRKPLRWRDLDEKPPYFFAFKRKCDANAFLKYLKSSIVRFLLACDKINMNLMRGELARIPFPHQYRSTKPFTYIDKLDDKTLCETLEVTPEEWKVIESVIPNYYSLKFNYEQYRKRHEKK